nr:hypothetical protein [Mycoplasmopsis bovis]
MAISCGNTSPYQNTVIDEKKEDIAKSWDKEISITNGWINNGFLKTKLETDFLDLLGKRFNDLKNKDSLKPKTYQMLSLL